MCGRYDNLIARDASAGSSGPSVYRNRTSRRTTTSRRPIRFPLCALTRGMVSASWSWHGGVWWFSKAMPKIPHINARAETVHEKALFREAFAKRRALIPATGFVEWQKRAEASSLIASGVRISNPSPSPAFGSSRGSERGRSSPPPSSWVNPIRLRLRCTTAGRLSSSRRL